MSNLEIVRVLSHKRRLNELKQVYRLAEYREEESMKDKDNISDIIKNSASLFEEER